MRRRRESSHLCRRARHGRRKSEGCNGRPRDNSEPNRRKTMLRKYVMVLLGTVVLTAGSGVAVRAQSGDAAAAPQTSAVVAHPATTPMKTRGQACQQEGGWFHAAAGVCGSAGGSGRIEGPGSQGGLQRMEGGWNSRRVAQREIGDHEVGILRQAPADEDARHLADRSSPSPAEAAMPQGR